MDEALVRIPLNQTTVPFTVTTPVFKSSVVATIMLCDTHATTTFSFVAELKNGNSHLSTDVCHAPSLLFASLFDVGSFSRTRHNRCCTSWSRHSGVSSSLHGSSTLSSSAFVFPVVVLSLCVTLHVLVPLANSTSPSCTFPSLSLSSSSSSASSTSCSTGWRWTRSALSTPLSSLATML